VSFESEVKDYFPKSDSTGPAGPIMEPYLESHYSLVKELDGYRIMERKGAEPAN
jgi:hypothetical protein